MKLAFVFAFILVLVVAGCGGQEIDIDEHRYGPVVVLTWPEHDGEQVSQTSAIIIGFDRSMDRESVEDSVRITPEVDVSLTWEGDARLVLRPVEKWPPGDVTITITDTARDSDGLPLQREAKVGFFAISTTLRVVSITPAAGEYDVDPSIEIVIEFDRPLADDMCLSALEFEPVVDGSLVIEDKVVRFIPDQLSESTNYTGLIRSGSEGVVAKDGSVLPGPVVFSFTTTAQTYLWTIDTRGSHQEMTTIAGMVSAIGWSPCGRHLAVMKKSLSDDGTTVGRQATLWIMNEMGRNVDQIWDEPLWLEANHPPLMWSPDGDRLVFCRTWHPELPSAVIVYDVWRGDYEVITPIFDYLKPASATFSPTGEAIAYRTFGDWYSRIFVHADGETVEVAEFPITAAEYSYHALWWTDQFISVDEEMPDEPGSIAVWTIDVDDKIVDMVTEGRNHNWSPDHDMLAVVVSDDVIVYDLVSGEKNVVAEGNVRWGPEWSPDGQWLAFEIGGVHGDGEVIIMRGDGSDKRIADVAGTGANAWHPLRSWLLVASKDQF